MKAHGEHSKTTQLVKDKVCKWTQQMRKKNKAIPKIKTREVMKKMHFTPITN